MSVLSKEKDITQPSLGPETAEDLLRIENLTLSIQTHRLSLEVLKGVSFRVPVGKTVALVGESGSGKSIIAQAILGILPQVAKITGGNIFFQDPALQSPPRDHASEDPDNEYMQSMRGGRISIIFQEPMTSLSPIHKVGDQVEEALVLHRDISKEEAKSVTLDMLKLVGFPDPERAYDMYSMELSGGLRQRAMIAMALICNPALLIADEPTTALDVTVQAQVLGLLKEMQKKLNMSLLLITHDLGVVANMADEVVIIYHGEILESGPIEEIFENPGHDYTKALMRAVPSLRMKKGDVLQALREADHTIPKMLAKNHATDPTKALLSVRNVTKSFGERESSWFAKNTNRFVAVDDVSFDIHQGECFGVVGESGCGKSTLSKLIMRALTVDSGKIDFVTPQETFDVSSLQGKRLKDYRRHAQIVFQDPFSSLTPRSTVLNTLMEPMEIHEMGNFAERKEYATELMSMVGLKPTFLNRYPHSFSGGQRQRIGIARALALSPELLICDEPVSALDVSVQAQILNLLRKLQSELGLTMLFISHNLAVIKYIADRIAVMRRGKIVEIASCDELFKNPIHPYTKTLLAAVPDIDPSVKLDFQALVSETENVEDQWDPVYRCWGEQKDGTKLHNIGRNHIVLANGEFGPSYYK
jgi:peptide/nickel transport system ATP-binding protein